MALTTGCRLAYVAGLILGVMGILGAQGGSLTQAPADSLLKIPVAGSRPKPPVQFSHRVHEARRLACTQCHHDYQGRRNVWHEGQPVAKCQTCHGLRPEARRLDVKNAYHRQCKGCHLRLRQQGRQAGPIECRGCHRPA
ncbi:MAG TPA: cytochrome c3 family protein [Desulfobaccales bacterium]|nr:cytochrome c3 family protein [Desulfobaccales bacterium]